MAVVWKETFAHVGKYEKRTLPADAEFLHVEAQHGKAALWYRTNGNKAECRQFEFILVGTGTPAPGKEGDRYLGTAQFNGGAAVYHLFVGR